MAIACEFLGIAAARQRQRAGHRSRRRPRSARAAGERVMELVRADVRPRDIITRTALENAIASVAATGGSTNAVLHLLAIAREAGVDARRSTTSIAISARTPLLADLKPSGRFVATDLHAAGGSPLVAKRLLEAERARTATRRRSPAGRSATKRRGATRRRASRWCGRSSKPLKKTRRPGHPARQPRAGGRGDEAVGHRARDAIAGPARVFDSEEAAFDAVQRQTIKPGDVVVIRYEGPSGGPGMREMLGVTGAIVGAGLGDTVALITDGRFSGRHARLHASGTSRPRRRAAARSRHVRDGDTIVHRRRQARRLDVEIPRRGAEEAAGAVDRRRRRATRPA